MASIPANGAVLKAPVIQSAALYCILLRSLMLFDIHEPLKNQSWNLYVAMSRMHVWYSRCFRRGSRPCDELPSIFMALRAERHLVT